MLTRRYALLHIIHMYDSDECVALNVEWNCTTFKSINLCNRLLIFILRPRSQHQWPHFHPSILACCTWGRCGSALKDISNLSHKNWWRLQIVRSPSRPMHWTSWIKRPCELPLQSTQIPSHEANATTTTPKFYVNTLRDHPSNFQPEVVMSNSCSNWLLIWHIFAVFNRFISI